MENIIFQKLLKKQNLSCYELSKRSGVPYSTIYSLLHDKYNRQKPVFNSQDFKNDLRISSKASIL